MAIVGDSQRQGRRAPRLTCGFGAVLGLVMLTGLPLAGTIASSNLDFEAGRIGEVPLSWNAQEALGERFLVAVTAQRPHGGTACVEIRRDSLSARSIGRIGRLSRALGAIPFRGHRVRVSGWVRFEPPAAAWALHGSARLWIRVNLTGGRVGFYEQMDGHPIRAAAWTYASVVGEVPAEADSILFGPALESGGSMWADDIGIERLGPLDQGDQPARVISRRGLQNLIAFARLLGYVRYFHPSDEAAEADWESFAIAGVSEVESAETAVDLRKTLERLFDPLAPTLRLSDRRLPALAASSLVAPGQAAVRYVGWWYHGWAEQSDTRPYYRQRIWKALPAAADSILQPGSEVNVNLGGGVWCSVPLTLYGDTIRTIPAGHPVIPLQHRPDGWIPSGSDRATRLADVILLWNVAKHFYPYFGDRGEAWLQALPPALQQAALDQDRFVFMNTLRRLIAALHDGHGWVTAAFHYPWVMPMEWTLAEGHLIVRGVEPAAVDQVHVGDEVVAIEGKPIRSWIGEAEQLVSAATPQDRRVKVGNMIQLLPEPDSLWIDVRSPTGVTTRCRISRRWGNWAHVSQRDSIEEVVPGVVYVDLSRVGRARFNEVLPQLVNAKAVVFDVRGDCDLSAVLPHLTDSTLESPRMCVPVIREPDQHNMTFDVTQWQVKPALPRLNSKAAFLIDGHAMSHVETFLSMVEHYSLAALVGEPTAGTNGNIGIVRLPGGYRVWFTAMRVLKQDGSPHGGVGILPTVPVVPTVVGLMAGRDEQLEGALAILNVAGNGAD